VKWLLQFGGITAAVLGCVIWFLRWRNGRLKNKNGTLVLENEALRNVLAQDKKTEKRMHDAELSRQKTLPINGVVDPSDPWGELRARDEKR
jgi:hypothetical protein